MKYSDFKTEVVPMKSIRAFQCLNFLLTIGQHDAKLPFDTFDHVQTSSMEIISDHSQLECINQDNTNCLRKEAFCAGPSNLDHHFSIRGAVPSLPEREGSGS